MRDDLRAERRRRAAAAAAARASVTPPGGAAVRSMGENMLTQQPRQRTDVDTQQPRPLRRTDADSFAAAGPCSPDDSVQGGSLARRRVERPTRSYGADAHWMEGMNTAYST